jgi:hypothetical protein
VQQPPRAELADYVRELERIALGHDPSASARDRLGPVKELVKLDSAPNPSGIVQVLLTEGPDGEVQIVEHEAEPTEP